MRIPRTRKLTESLRSAVTPDEKAQIEAFVATLRPLTISEWVRTVAVSAARGEVAGSTPTPKD